MEGFKTVGRSLAMKLGADLSRRQTHFKGVSAPASDFVIDPGFRSGARLAITTEPGLTPWPDSNLFFRLTAADLSLYLFDEVDDYKTKTTFLDGEVQIPFRERNFVELGLSYYKVDRLWWKNYTPQNFLPTNFRIGWNRQIQGDAVPASYSMIGLRGQVAAVNLYPLAGVHGFSGGKLFEPSLTAHGFGEQRMDSFAAAYRLYTDFYPTWKKIEAGASLSLQIPLGEEMQFYVEGQGRLLESTQEDNDPLLPDAGYELSVGAGLGFKPSQVF